MEDALWTNPSVNGGAMLIEGHLGGTRIGGDADSWFPELWDWLIEQFALKTMLDVGCGVGQCQNFFAQRGLQAFGIDGSSHVLRHHVSQGHLHNLNYGPFLREEGWDLVWCCELAEHIEPRLVDNVVRTVAENARKVVAFCAAPEGAGGHHHVNCRSTKYWIDLLTKKGLKHSPVLTTTARNLCLPGRQGREASYFFRSGLIFTVGE